MSGPLKVAIVGARGIGKHHAKWYSRCGCEVVAVFGTTEDSAAAGAAALRDLFGFSGRAYHDWKRFRREAAFEACSVCSPPERHLENARDLLEDGRHVLCEKPLVWDWDRDPEQLLSDANAIVETAARHGLVLAMNAQYPAALPGCLALFRDTSGAEPHFSELTFVMETKVKSRSGHGAAEVWIDLGPHPLAFTDAVAPGGIDWATLRHAGGPLEAVLNFDWLSGDDRLAVHVECRRRPDGVVRRLIGNQDLTISYEGANVDGEFCTRLRAGEREWIGPDLMRTSVERFVEAVRAGGERKVLVDGRGALRQQEALLGVWARCWRGAGESS